MKFVSPSFLFALAAIAVPILIHLFNFRKFKTVYFSNVQFLKEVKQHTQSQSKLKHLLVLLMRILAISFLVFAFAQPYLPINNKVVNNAQKAVSIYIDNSFSMDATGKTGTLLEEAKRNAIAIAAAYKPSDKFNVLTNDFEGKHQRWINREEFLERVKEIKVSPAVKKVSETFSRQQDMLTSSNCKVKDVFIVSDFQKSITDVSAISNDTAANVYFVPGIVNKEVNLYIDSCWFATPARQINKVEELMVRVRNSSDKEIENVPLKLSINNVQKAVSSFNIAAGETITTKISFTCKESGIHFATVELSDYPIVYDDKFYFTFDVAGSIKVLAINGQEESPYLNSLFGNDAFFKYSNVSEKAIDYSALPLFNFVVLNEINTVSSGLAQELKRYVSNGGSLLVFPSVAADVNSYQSFLSSLGANYYTAIDTVNTKAEGINLKHPLYSDVFSKIPENMDLPAVFSHYTINKNNRSKEEYLIKLHNGDVFMAKYQSGKGTLYLSAVPMNTDFSNLVKHAVFVPTLYKMALFSIPQSNLFYTIGRDNSVEVTNIRLAGDNVFHIRSLTSTFDLVPEAKLIESNTVMMLHNQLSLAGNYLLSSNTDSIKGLGFNYDRKESELACYTSSELQEQYEKVGYSNFSVIESKAKDITTTLKEAGQGKPLWKICILMVLLFLAAEVLLLRFWRSKLTVNAVSPTN
jgi:hypothetical protein